MKGFFTGERKQRKKNNAASKDPCERCGLWETCLTPKTSYTGKGQKKILIIGEAPGREEDEGNPYFEPGTQFIGQAGRLLRDKVARYGLDLERDCWKINAVNCRPPSNRTPTRKEVKCCKEFIVDKTIEELKPNYIWLLGKKAVESFYVGRFSHLEINRWRGLIIPDRLTGAWVLPMYHPSFLLRTEKKIRGGTFYDKNTETIYDIDLKRAFAHLQNSESRPKFQNYESKVEIVTDIDRFNHWFDYLLNDTKKIVAFDFETSALKPFGGLPLIWSMSIAFRNRAISFPISYPHWTQEEKGQVLAAVALFLMSNNIEKIAHNLKFEDVWARVILKVAYVAKWLWCTMNAAHIIDERRNFTTLKFQSYIEFGMDNYGKDVKPLMEKINPETGRNRLDEVPLEDLLLYGGLDSLMSLNLFMIQRHYILHDERREAYKLTHEGLKALADTQIRGIPVDSIYYREQDEYYEKKIDTFEQALLNTGAAKKFKKKYNREINLDSTPDLRKLFTNVLKTKIDKKTKKGFVSVDHHSLLNINDPFAQRLIRLRKLKKIKGTYLAQFLREIANDRIYPFIDLHIPRSHRSSSSDPNFQNIPIREEEPKRVVRCGIVPEPGCKIGLIDYGSQEVRIIACYSKDGNLIAYIEDESTDMHRDQAAEIFVLNEKQMTSLLRFYAKNQFVFPEFYGSYFVSCARNIWDNCIELETGEGVKVLDHLIDVGVMADANDYDSFEAHIKEVEKNFWDRFPQVKEWQERSIREYQRKGYITTFFGHRRGGLLTNNMIINTPIQATAFHCLLWSYIKANTHAKRYWQSYLMGQIHDEMVYNLQPDEERDVISTSVDIMENKIRERFDFLIVPLRAEVELTDIDAAWYYKKEVDHSKIKAQ